MRKRFSTVPAFAVLLAACVTVNVYFPAAAAQQAADQIIDKVTGQSGPGSAPSGAPSSAPPSGAPAVPRGPESAPQGAPTVPPTSFSAPTGPSWGLRALGRLVDLVISPANAQGSANLDISTPEIRAITASMQRRFAQLEPFFSSGAVGMTADGLVIERDLTAVPLAQRALVARLVAEDNRDRNALYTAIAQANGHPEWAADIRRTFARRWVERGARPGWYYQDASGNWQRK